MCFFAFAGAGALAADVDVRAFGAKGDGVAVETSSIQQAIDACSKQGGGHVNIPAGRFVSGTILLRDHVTLHLDKNAVLLGSANIADYQAPDKFRSGNGAEMGYCFIGAVDAKEVGIIGEGLIDGRGSELLAARPKGNNARPFLARFVRCDGVNVEGTHLRGPAAWTMHFSQCKNVKAAHITINSRGLPNNDGIDIDSSENVRIEACDIDSGDDSICLKTTSLSPCRNIDVSDCNLKSHWGGIKFGTESAANFENIKITNCRIHEAQGGIKLFSVDGAKLQNVSISEVTMENVNLPIFIRLGARLKTFRAGDAPQPVGTISNVMIKNLKADAVSPVGIVISGIPGHRVNEVTLENIELRLPGGGTRDAAPVELEEEESAYPEITMFGKQFPACALFARHVKGLKAAGVKLELAAPDFRPAVVCDDVENPEFSRWALPENLKDAGPLVQFKPVRRARVSGPNP